jgi:regulator of replication initiation timing
VIIRLTESDGGQNDALTMMATQKQDFKKKYLEQVEMNNKLEQENEALRKQVIDLTDLSFAKGF